MAYVRVPKDLTDFTPKFMLGLTLRQLVCAIGALVVAAPSCYIAWLVTGDYEIPTYVAFVVAIPFAAVAIFRKNGLTLERFLLVFLRVKVLGQPRRKYQTENFYQLLGQDLGLTGQDEGLEETEGPEGLEETADLDDQNMAEQEGRKGELSTKKKQKNRLSFQRSGDSAAQ